MAKDIDYFIDTTSTEELIAGMDPAILRQSSFGFHVSADSAAWFNYLDKVLSPGQKFPLQIMSGPSLTLRYISAIPDTLVSLIQSEKVVLCVHLPFVVTMYKDPKSLGYQWEAFKELRAHYESRGILDKVLFLFHCSHPAFTADGDFRVQWSYWKAVALENLAAFKLYLPNLLIENLAGYLAEPFDISSPNGIWTNLLAGSELQDQVGLAIDTEHLYASGHYLNDLLPEVIQRTKFIHCNAAPPSVIFGAHLDLHSYTSIQSSLDRGCGPWVAQGSTFEDYVSLGLDKIPAIFERKYLSLQVQDLKTMLEKCSR